MQSIKYKSSKYIFLITHAEVPLSLNSLIEQACDMGL